MDPRKSKGLAVIRLKTSPKVPQESRVKTQHQGGGTARDFRDSPSRIFKNQASTAPIKAVACSKKKGDGEGSTTMTKATPKKIQRANTVRIS